VASTDKPQANKAMGSVEDINDDTLGTDKISGGPLANRLLSLLRFEHRTSPTENGTTNGAGPSDSTNVFSNDASMDLDSLTNGNLDPSEPKPFPSASSVAEQYAPKPNNGSTNGANGTGHPSADDRIKTELRHLGFLGVDEEPDFDGHHDDDISVRLRLLQSELNKVMITNGARKARLLDIARERLAYQEYSTIHEDLDSQVQQAYLKRTRTLGKSKKGHHQNQGGGGGGTAGRPRPNAAANSSAAAAAGLARQRDIGDSARMLMDRRKRWEDCIGPVFEGMRQGVPRGVEAGGESLWDPRIMERYEKAEREGLEEETDG
jgi:transcriptional adapter 3